MGHRKSDPRVESGAVADGDDRFAGLVCDGEFLYRTEACADTVEIYDDDVAGSQLPKIPFLCLSFVKRVV